ncbi:MAG: type II secretion system secretin GspD [Ahniella sp.]|nr:type II secretion system secretin GspD [Ahniella sp.]
MKKFLLASLLVLSQSAFAQEQTHTLNLKDADIRILISSVSEITGKNFIVDPRVEGKVNVVSAKPMAADEVYQVFESVLRVHGYALIPAGNMVKILPEAVAKQDGAASLNGGLGPDSMVTRVIPVRYVAPAQVVQVLTPLVPQSGSVVVSPAGNSVIITDRAGNATRLEKLIQRIDIESDSAIEIISLSHANATEVANTVNRLGDKSGAAGSPSANAVADARTNSILLSGDPSARLKLRALIGHLDTPLGDNDATEVVYLRYAKAEDLVAVLDGVAQTLTGESAGTVDKPSARTATIQVHKETNALIITAAPAVFRELQAVVRRLDVRRAQVMIEAIIAEVSDEAIKEIGVQWQATDSLNGSEGFVGGTNFPDQTGNGSIVGAITNPLGALGRGFNVGYLTGTTTLPGTDDTVYEIGALAKLLRGDGRSNILSQPSIVTLDNKEANITVGQEVPFLTGSYTNAGSTSGGNNQPNNPFQTIERKEIGIKLKVTPRINEGDSVALDIFQEVSSLAPTPAGATDLVTNKREISTSVMVQDGGMLVLGGLISNQVDQSVNKVPGLGDIPLLGNLFKYRNSKMQKRNLMVFLRPTILRDPETERVISQEKYNLLRAEQIQAREHRESMIREEEMPILQEWGQPLRADPRAEATPHNE